MTRSTVRAPLGPRGVLVAAGAVVVVAAASTVAVAAVAGAFESHSGSVSADVRTASGCTVPSLPGTTVAVRLADMGSRMGGGSGGMMGGPDGDGAMGQGGWRNFRPGVMRVLASPSSVPAGAVSLLVTNTGYLIHELVVLPLSAGQQPGTRPVGADGTVAETGSLGEASASCAAGAGEGIAAGSTGWVTLQLPAGRYELVCNLPGHYTAGMYTELDVT